MKVELTANECIILAALCNSRMEVLRQDYPLEEDLIQLYTNLRNKIIQ